VTGVSDSSWYSRFQVEAAGRPESDIVWTDAEIRISGTGSQTDARRKTLDRIVGVFAIGFIALMAVTLIVAVYISRH